MSLWISEEKYNVRQYKYCSCLLYHIVCFIGQVTCAEVILGFFFFLVFWVSFWVFLGFFLFVLVVFWGFFVLFCFGFGCFCGFGFAFFFVWLGVFFFPPVLIRKHYSGNIGEENSFPLYFAIGELNEFEISK